MTGQVVRHIIIFISLSWGKKAEVFPVYVVLGIYVTLHWYPMDSQIKISYSVYIRDNWYNFILYSTLYIFFVSLTEVYFINKQANYSSTQQC